MSRIHHDYIPPPADGDARPSPVYSCQACRTHLVTHDDLVSKAFTGRHGPAWLFADCLNVTLGPAESRMLTTGLHVVADTFCMNCEQMVGWKYHEAFEASEKYKIGKYIVERGRMAS